VGHVNYRCDEDLTFGSLDFVLGEMTWNERIWYGCGVFVDAGIDGDDIERDEDEWIIVMFGGAGKNIRFCSSFPLS
jgi:hypothetical protein